MQYLDQPYYKKEGNIFILYRANFTTNKDGFSENTYVAGGNSIEARRFSTLNELQQKSNELFGRDAKEIKN